jgi:serine O-acetyltransferase
MKFNEYKYLVKSDLYRYGGKISFTSIIRALFFYNKGEGFKYSFWMRTSTYTLSHPILKYSVYPFARHILYFYKYKFGISILHSTKIDSGFYIGHFGSIIINEKCIIGKNCNISQGVTLGQSNRGKRKGTPTLRDNIYIGPGAKIIGKVTIGNNVAIGANCVVTNDIKEHSVVVGIPSRVISFNGSKGYINFTGYNDELSR